MTHQIQESQLFFQNSLQFLYGTDNYVDSLNDIAQYHQILWRTEDHDLQYSLVAAPTWNPYVGDNMQIEVYITNAGTVDLATSVPVCMYLNRTAPPQPSDTPDYSIMFLSIQHGSIAHGVFPSLQNFEEETWSVYIMIDQWNIV
jgi:hypothetical protein